MIFFLKRLNQMFLAITVQIQQIHQCYQNLMNILKVQKKKKFMWSTEHSSKVKEEFNDFIQKNGPYPTNSKIQDFFY